MNKRSITLTLCLLLVVSSLIPISLGFNVKFSRVEKPSLIRNSKFLYVGGGGPDNYSKIQDAIDNASDGDTVFVYDDCSPYYEKIVIDKSIILHGEDKNSTLIDGSKNYTLYVITAISDDITICNFTIQNKKYSSGYHCMRLNGDNCKIINNIFLKNCVGIECTTIGSVFDGNYIASYYCSIDIHGSDNNIIFNNTIKGMYGDGKFNINRDTGYFPGIYLTDSNFNIIENNDIYSNAFGGIEMINSDNNQIIGNNCDNNFEGMYISNSNENNITNNKISYSNYGFWIESSCQNNIESNIISNNYFDGINISFSSENNSIKYNKIELNIDNGIAFDSYSDSCSNNYNLVCCNNVSKNKYGIKIYGPNNNISIFQNNISDNQYGIHISDRSSYNSIYHNNFLNNSENAHDECNNTWDDGKYGNHWSDYKERYPDAKKKFLKPWMWDTPYEISNGNNKDMCPLVDQWHETKSRVEKRNITPINYYWLRLIDMFLFLTRLLIY